MAVNCVQGRLQTLPLCESTRDDVIDSITKFLSPRNYSKVTPIIAHPWLCCNLEGQIAELWSHNQARCDTLLT